MFALIKKKRKDKTGTNCHTLFIIAVAHARKVNFVCSLSLWGCPERFPSLERCQENDGIGFIFIVASVVGRNKLG